MQREYIGIGVRISIEIRITNITKMLETLKNLFLILFLLYLYRFISFFNIINNNFSFFERKYVH
jgi:hypothetical protein